MQKGFKITHFLEIWKLTQFNQKIISPQNFTNISFDLCLFQSYNILYIVLKNRLFLVAGRNFAKMVLLLVEGHIFCDIVDLPVLYSNKNGT